MRQSFNRRSAWHFLLLGFALAGCGEGGIGADWKRLEPGIEAADFALPTLDGQTVTLAGLRGRVIIMEFWATWCGPCRFSLPSLEVIAKRYADRGVAVLLINEGEPADVVRAWSGKRFPTCAILLDASQAIGTLYDVQGIPQLFVVDPEGRLIYTHDGYGGGLERTLSLILDGMLGPPAASDV